MIRAAERVWRVWAPDTDTKQPDSQGEAMSLRLAHAASRVQKDAEIGATAVSDAMSRAFGGTSTAMSALLEDKANGTIRGAVPADSLRGSFAGVL